MSDFFHPGADRWRTKAWNIIRECDHLDWLILTKRPELILDRLPPDWGDGYAKVWLGVTVGAASSMDRIDRLKAVPATVRFISAEPLLERIDFTPHLDGSIHWIITGCERAAKEKRRLMDVDWVRDIDRQCRRARIAHYFKQYYVDDRGIPVEDGLLDDTVCQAWPLSSRSQRRTRSGVFRAGE
jgi:protein gp37